MAPSPSCRPCRPPPSRRRLSLRDPLLIVLQCPPMAVSPSTSAARAWQAVWEAVRRRRGGERRSGRTTGSRQQQRRPPLSSPPARRHLRRRPLPRLPPPHHRHPLSSSGSPSAVSTSPSPRRLSSSTLSSSHWQSAVSRLSALSSRRDDPAALSLQLYRLIEDVRHSFSFPLPAAVVSASAFSSFLSSLLSALRAHYVSSASSHVSSSQYLQAEQALLTSSTGLQFLQLLIDKGAITGGSGEGEAQDVRDVAQLLLDVVEAEKARRTRCGDDEQRGDADAGQQSWLQVDALRALSRLLDRRHPALLPLQPRILPLLLPALDHAGSVTTPSPPSSEPPSPALSSRPSSSASSYDAILSEEQRLSFVCLTALAGALDGTALSSLLPRLLLAMGRAAERTTRLHVLSRLVRPAALTPLRFQRLTLCAAAALSQSWPQQFRPAVRPAFLPLVSASAAHARRPAHTGDRTRQHLSRVCPIFRHCQQERQGSSGCEQLCSATLLLSIRIAVSLLLPVLRCCTCRTQRVISTLCLLRCSALLPRHTQLCSFPSSTCCFQAGQQR